MLHYLMMYLICYSKLGLWAFPVGMCRAYSPTVFEETDEMETNMGLCWFVSYFWCFSACILVFSKFWRGTVYQLSVLMLQLQVHQISVETEGFQSCDGCFHLRQERDTVAEALCFLYSHLDYFVTSFVLFLFCWNGGSICFLIIFPSRRTEHDGYRSLVALTYRYI